MDRKLITYTGLLVALVALIVGGCRERITAVTPDYVEYGWELMAEESYRAAAAQFETGTDLDILYADGWNGQGWAYARLGAADTSEAKFRAGKNLADTSIVGKEILAGRSFALLALGRFSDAVSDAKDVLSPAPTWVFRRDETVTYLHLTLTVATGFYGQGEFDSSLVWVKRLDDTFSADTTLSGRARLAAKLEELKSEL